MCDRVRMTGQEPVEGVVLQSRSPSRELSTPAPIAASVADVAGLARPNVPQDAIALIDALPQAEWAVVVAWLQSQRSVTTRQTYMADFVAWMRWLKGRTSPVMGILEATEDAVTAYRDEIGTGATLHGLGRWGHPLAPVTVKRRVSVLSSFYTYAERRTAIPNQAQYVKRPEVGGEGKTPALSRRQAEALMLGCEDIARRYPVDAAAVALMLHTAIRIAEVCTLRVESILTDSGHCVMSVRRKGGKVATLPIPPRVCVLLEPLMADRNPGDRLFTRPGTLIPWDRYRGATAVKRAARQAGIVASQLTPHVMRATAITLLIEAGVPLEQIREFTGHQSVDMVLRYNRSQTKLDANPAYRMASLLGGGS